MIPIALQSVHDVSTLIHQVVGCFAQIGCPVYEFSQQGCAAGKLLL